MKNISNTLQDLVAVDSTSGHEKKFSQVLIRTFKPFAKKIQQDSYGNVIIKIDGEGEPLLLNAHMDTVEPGRGIKPIITGDKIHTDGSTVLGADPKAGIAAILSAILTAQEKNIKLKPLEIVFTREEEIGLKGVKNLDFSLISAKKGIVFDGQHEVTNVTVKGPGYDSIDIQVTGKAAHAGANPEDGISSIQIASRLISNLTLGRIDKETTANIGKIEGGSGRNVVPEITTLQAEVRSHDSEKLEKYTEMFRTEAKAAENAFPGSSVTVTVTRNFDPYVLNPESQIVKEVLSALSALNLDGKLITSGGGTDAHIFNQKGIETVVVGTGGYNAHTTNEYALISEMEKCARFCLELIKA